MKSRHYLLLGILSALAVFATSSLWLAASQQVFKGWLELPEDQELVILRPNPAIGLDPARLTDQESLRITANIFETLVRFDPQQQRLVPALAQSWSASEDGREWLFKLQRDVLFHDGTRCDAKAVAFNFERWMDVNNPYHTGTFNYWAASFGYENPIVSSVEALSDYTLRIVLTEPYAPFLDTLALPSFGISSPQNLKTYNDGIMFNPIGTGPFRLDRWEDGNRVTLVANARYWSTPPKVSRIRFETVSDEATRLKHIAAGDAHIAEGISQWQDVSQDNYRLINRPYNNVGYLAFNLEKPYLQSLELRQAIAMAIDKERLLQVAFPGDTRIASGFVPPVIWGYHENLQAYHPPYSPTRAKALLHNQNIAIKLLVMEEPRAYFPQPFELAEAIAKDLSQVGIRISIEVAPWKAVVERGKQGDYDLLLAGWVGDIADPDNFLYTLFASQNATLGHRTNYAAYKSPDVDKRLARARASYDVGLRAELYREVQEIIAQDLPAIPLVHTRPTVAVANGVDGYSPSLPGDERLDLVSLRKVTP